MSGSVNKVILVGNLGRDPEYTQTQDGRRFARLSVATSERWRDRQSGERREQTEWHRVVIFNENLVDVSERFLRKGSKVFIEGQLQTRKWQDQSGADRYSTEVVLSRFRGELTMLDGRGDGSDSGEPGGDYGGDYQRGQQGSGGMGGARQVEGGRSAPMDLDDDIPF
jgi:single-strand DNA-binding protein